MKKIIMLLLVVLLVAMPVIGCSDNKELAEVETSDNGKLKVVATIFPAYDWVREVAGDKAELTLLQSQGVDLHSYQPTVQDMAKISDCDLFIYVGGVSDSWVEEAIQNAKNESIQTLNLLEVLGDRAKLEEMVEGMQEEEHDHEEEEAKEEDEHIWLSLKNAQIITEAITEKLVSLDSENGNTYQENLAAYNEKLSSLDQEFASNVADAKAKTLVFGDRFPFRYLLDDYEIDYYAAFPGCSAETEASFETIIFLADKVDELGLKDVMVLENSNEKIAQSIIQNTKEQKAEIVVLNSLQSAVDEGETYLSVMANNLQTLEEVFK